MLEEEDCGGHSSSEIARQGKELSIVNLVVIGQFYNNNNITKLYFNSSCINQLNNTNLCSEFDVTGSFLVTLALQIKRF